ncbi:MAG: hypothetical protein ACRDQA_03060, partial [Nocardioidaceae bacterium]
NGYQPYAAQALAAEVADVRGTAEGGRNARLNIAALKLSELVAGGHLDKTDVHDRLRAASLAAGLTSSETEATIRSGFAKGMTQPRDIPEADFAETQVTVVASLSQAETDTFWGAHPLLDHLHMFARARRVSPWAVLGVTLTRVATAVPPSVVLPPIVGSSASLNLYLALVGRSGAGKGAAEGVATEALTIPGVDTFTPGSGEGIAHVFWKRTKDGLEPLRQAALFTLPEIDSLGGLGARRGATLLPELRKAWSGERLGFAYATPEKNIPMPAHSYRLSLVAGVQPGRGHVLLDDEAAGTPQRFFWLPATDPDAPDNAPDCPEPARWTPQAWGRLRHDTHGKNVLDVCDQARAEVVAEHLARIRGNAEAIDGHAMLCQLKVAAVLGLMLGHAGVDDTDWWLAGQIQRVSDSTRDMVTRVLREDSRTRNAARGAAEAERAVHVEESKAEAATKRVCGSVMRAVRRADGEALTLRQIRVNLSGASARERLDDAIDRLEKSGDISVETDGQTTWVKEVTHG